VIAYCGQTRDPKMNRILKEHGIGECTVRGELKSRKRDPWFYDNGAYRDWQAGAAFNGLQFHRDCRRMRILLEASKGRPDFVVLPDKVMGGLESLAMSESFAVEAEGLPCYVAVQNGMTIADVGLWIDRVTVEPELGPPIQIAGIFVGGDTGWKIETSRSWVNFAHARGIRCHIGRVGTPDRVHWARSIGADSIDSCLPIMFTEHLHPFLAAVAA